VNEGAAFAAESTRPSAMARFGRVLRERWWIVLLTTLACVLAAVIVSTSQATKYDASATLLFRNPGFSSALFGSSVFEPSLDPARESTTNLQLVESREVAKAVKDELGLSQSPGDLLDQVTVEERTNSDVVDIIVRDESPQQAARIAASFADEYVAFRQAADRRKIVDAEELIRDRLEGLPPEATAERTELQNALQKLIALEAVQTGNAEVIDRPQVPTVAAAPQTKRDVAVALIVGLGLGLLIAFLLDVVDRRVKSSEEFEQLYRVPALVTVPQSAFDSRRRREEGAAFEPFRILYSSLSFLAVSGPLRTVMVTSAVAEEGKTSVAVNLARAIALSGNSVALVEADLRRPSFRRHVQDETMRIGLTNALVGSQSALELIRYLPPNELHVDVDEEVLTPRPHGDIHGLVGVLQSGPVPPNSAELLRSPRMVELLDELREVHDYVVVDAPPLLPVADAQVMLAHGFMDACLVAARVYKTTRDHARRARAILDQAHVQRVGLVVTGVRESPGGYEYYSRVGDEQLADASRDRAGRAPAT
jgi:polysaccharide biosynthesis transport protein